MTGTTDNILQAGTYNRQVQRQADNQPTSTTYNVYSLFKRSCNIYIISLLPSVLKLSNSSFTHLFDGLLS